MPVRRYTATADGARFLEGEGVLHLTGGVLRHVCCPSSSYDSTIADFHLRAPDASATRAARGRILARSAAAERERVESMPTDYPTISG